MRGRRDVIAEPGVESRQIDRVIEAMIDRVLERPREQLPRQINRNEPGTGVDVLVAGHGGNEA